MIRAFKAPPATPALGATTADVRKMYTSAGPCAQKPSFQGRVLWEQRGEDTFHFVMVDGRLQEIIYSTRWSSHSGKALGKKLEYFLNAYGGAENFEIVLDNGFGYTIHRNDKAVWALYSYAADVFSVGYIHNGKMAMLDWED